jgi:hypothetical protein
VKDLLIRRAAAGASESTGGEELQDEEEGKASPEVAAAALGAAQQELAVLIDLIGSVASQRIVHVQYVDSRQPPLETFRQIAVAVQGCRKRLTDGALRLREAAAQLREQTKRGHRFVQELSELQVCLCVLAPAKIHASLQPHSIVATLIHFELLA